jgi:3-methylcrotonyl-CoA carboxylase alpha subunit
VLDGWRLNDEAHETITLVDGETPVAVEVRSGRAGMRVIVPDGEVEVSGELGDDGRIWAVIGGVAINASIVAERDRRGVTSLTVSVQDSTWRLGIEDPLAVASLDEAEGGRLTAPMPGRVTRVLAEVGARVERGAPLMVIEAMKMEHIIAAPADGQVERVKFAVGDLVGEGETLLDFLAEE